MQWTSPFILPLRPPIGDAHVSAPTRTSIPKNLTIRFGARRASVYGSSAAAKTALFAASAKNSAREAHAQAFIQKPIQPKILEEEFLDYRKLLDDMAAYPTLVTLICLPSLAAAPSASGQKRSRGIPTESEGEIEDTGTSVSGGLQEANASGAADPSLLATQGPQK
jgi:hypothetical protein